MTQSIRRQDWFAVFVEILVVIVGLMLAFQLDRWWEQRGDSTKEAQYIERLIADIEVDVENLEFALDLQTIRFEMAELLMAVVEDPEAASRRPVEFLGAVLQSSYLYTPIPIAHTFDDLQSTGNMRLLDTDLKALLRCQPAAVSGNLAPVAVPTPGACGRNSEPRTDDLHPG